VPRWRNRTLAVLAVSAVGLLGGYGRMAPCLTGGWNTAREFADVYYSDIHALYVVRHMEFPAVPYRNYEFEYPVGTGAFAYTAAAITAGLTGLGLPGSHALVYFTLSALLLALSGVIAIWLTTLMPGARPGDAAYLALGMFAMGYINWDLLTVALTAGALYAWSRERPCLCGALLGWGAASKAYPALLLVPLLLVCIRARRPRAFASAAFAAAATWLVLNAAYIFGPLHAGWTLFYTFSFHRDADLGTVWHLLGHVLPGHWPGHHLDLAVSISLVVFTLAIAALALLAPRAPSLGQLSFLILAAFLLTSKSWSPQYGLWLLPFAALTRLPWRALITWLALDIAFYMGGMWYVNHQIHGSGPGLDLSQILIVVAVHWLALLGMCVLVARDVLRQKSEGPASLAVGRDILLTPGDLAGEAVGRETANPRGLPARQGSGGAVP
jgi:uncharacterized membrane protein